MDLARLKLVDLKELCRENKWKGYSRLRKAELIEFIKVNLIHNECTVQKVTPNKDYFIHNKKASQLKELCRENKWKGYSRLRKSELIGFVHQFIRLPADMYYEISRWCTYDTLVALSMTSKAFHGKSMESFKTEQVRCPEFLVQVIQTPKAHFKVDLFRLSVDKVAFVKMFGMMKLQKKWYNIDDILNLFSNCVLSDPNCQVALFTTERHQSYAYYLRNGIKITREGIRAGCGVNIKMLDMLQRGGYDIELDDLKHCFLKQHYALPRPGNVMTRVWYSISLEYRRHISLAVMRAHQFRNISYGRPHNLSIYVAVLDEWIV